MTGSQRIALNTLATFARSVFGMALGLFSSRFVLQALGHTDFGLYGVVGSVIVFITLVSSVLSGSIARFYAYAIGTGVQTMDSSNTELTRLFNTALSIHVVLPILAIAIGYPLGIYGVHHWLCIPPDRLSACVWVFRIAMISALVSMITAPYIAMFIAHQHIWVVSIFGVLGTVVNFIGAYWLLQATGDRLILYALIVMVSGCGISLFQVLCAHHVFKSCRVVVAMLYDWTRIRQVLSFAGWQLFGTFSIVVQTNGSAILINRNYLPSVNAAYGIAAQLSAQSSSLSAALIGAFVPAVATMEGSGSRGKMIQLALQMCKFGTLLVLLFVIPLALEMDEVLRLWLVNPPDYTGGLCILMLAIAVVDKLSAGCSCAISAVGEIREVSLVNGLGVLMALPVAWGLIQCRFGPLSVGYAAILTMTYCSLGRIYYARKQVGVSFWMWVRVVLLPLFAVTCLSSVAGYGIRCAMETGFMRICATTVTTLLVTGVFGYVVVLTAEERAFVIRQMVQQIRR